MPKTAIDEIFKQLGAPLTDAGDGLAVTSPGDGSVIARLAVDDAKNVDRKVILAQQAQQRWAALSRDERAQKIEAYSAALKAKREQLAELIHLEAGKTLKESFVEADGSADILPKTIKDASMAELNGMLRSKERPAAGVVGLITSFNFPMVVAHWTLGPALLAGNAVVWKPSEKTPLAALACKAIFDQSMGEFSALLQTVIGLREVGQALVAHEQVDVISATGSVAMGQGIKATLAKKKNNALAPILELGGNNGVIISQKISPEHLKWAVKSLLNSFLGTTGQRCTNTRRLIVHSSIYESFVAQMQTAVRDFLNAAVISGGLDPANDYGYGALIDKDAFERLEKARTQASSEGGSLLLGKRLFETQHPDAYYIEPVLALMPKQSAIMHQETFAPILFITPYDGDIDDAIALLNAPDNAGLVNGIYTQSQREADRFAARNEAGHSVINSPKGTGTPAFGMGFGGNKESGTGEILNAADPLQAFTRPGVYSRIAQNKDILMNAD